MNQLAIIQTLEPRIINSLKELGWWQTNKTINLQAVGCGPHQSGEVRVSWDGSILGYFSEAGWTKDIPAYSQFFSDGRKA